MFSEYFCEVCCIADYNICTNWAKKKTRQISANILEKIRGRVMVFYATFNNISVILRWSVLLVTETGVPEENHRSAISQ